MPFAPARPCVVFPCPRLVHGGSRCPEHQRVQDQERASRRGSTTARGYDWTWTTLVRRKMRETPYCVLCLSEGSPGNPLTGDHILPLSQGGANTYDNVRILCRHCNSSLGGALPHQ